MSLDRNRETHSNIDAKTPLYSSRIMASYLEFIKKYYPDFDIDSALKYAGTTRYEVEDAGHWFNQEQTDRFHEILVLKTGNPNIARDAGRFIVSSERLGAAKQYALGLITMPSMYLMVGKLANSLTRGSTFKAKKIAANQAEILSIPEPGVKEKPYQCQNRLGIMEAIAKLFTETFAEIEHPSCFHKGGACCRYIVTWPRTPSLTWMRIRKYSLLFSLLILLGTYPVAQISTSIVLTLICAFAHLMIWLYAERIGKKELMKTIENQGNAAKALLDEMNTRHSNALLIQEVGQTVSGILDIDEISRAVLEIIQKHTNFDFGSIILADENKTKLQPAAEFNNEDSQFNLIKCTEIGLLKEESGGVLRSCFKERKPFMINEAADGGNDLLTNISTQLNMDEIDSFICVPITYKNESLGILAVGNFNSKKTPTQSDLSLLMGVASHTATSIINALSFKAIKKSEERYRLLADNVTDVIWILDIASLYFSYISPSVKLQQGFTPQELMGMPLQEILTPDSFKKARETIAEGLLLEKRRSADPVRSTTLELEEYCKDGSTIWIEVTASFLRDDSGKVNRILGVTRDISERKLAEKQRKELEEQLQRAQKMEAIGTLAGGVAHDLNNILSGIISYPELLLMDLPPNSPFKQPIETIQESGKKAAAIVEDLLTLARRGVPVAEIVNLNDIISQYLMSPEFDKLSTFHPRVKIETNLDPDILNIQGSSVHLSKTIMNLVSNAAEAMPDGGSLHISTQNQYIDRPIKGYDEVQEGDYAVIEIRDTGIGIPPEDLQQVFEPFYTKKMMGRSGTGLGMTVVWGTVKDHRGYIDLESVQNKGTRFKLYFPVTRKRRNDEKTDFSIKDNMGNGESILVVDDVKEQRQIAKSILLQLGYSVQTVSCGEAAVDYMKNNTADLLILDMIMDPGIDGLETYKQILKQYPGQKAVIASGYSETDRVKEAQQLGAGEYIKKPYTIKKISSAIKSELAGAKVS